MFKTLIFIFIFVSLFLTNLLGYEYFSTDLKNVYITQTKLLKTQNTTTTQEVLKSYANGDFISLSKKSYGKGFSNDIFWLTFKLNSLSDEPLYLLSNYNSIDTLELYKIKDNQIISKDILTNYPKYIKLGTSHKNITYLIKYKTDTPVLISFEITLNKYLHKHIYDQNYLTVFLCGIAIALILYNLFLFVSTRNTLYLYYTLMCIGFLSYNLFIRFGDTYLNEYYILYKYHIIVVLLCFSMIFLYLFMNTFLNLKDNFPKYKKISKILLFIILGIFVTILLTDTLKVALMILFNIFLITMFLIALKVYFGGYKIAKYFLVATGVQVVSHILMPLVIFGKIEYTLISYNLSFIGLIWDMIFLSFAIGFRIRELEKNEAFSEIILAKSRQATLGSMIDTISHQWKQPLNELGLQLMHIDTQLRFEGKVPSKESLEKTIEKSNNILEFMSKTIDIFRNFFKTSDNVSDVNISKVLDSTILFLDSTFEAENIHINKEIESHIKIKAIEEEFAHSILNILVNAKDNFSARGIKNQTINIKMYKNNNEKIIITIEDNGGGIEINPIEKIFQADTSTKPNGGVGLFITKKIIEEKLDGSIDVENTQYGAKFTIIL